MQQQQVLALTTALGGSLGLTSLLSHHRYHSFPYPKPPGFPNITTCTPSALHNQPETQTNTTSIAGKNAHPELSLHAPF